MGLETKGKIVIRTSDVVIWSADVDKQTLLDTLSNPLDLQYVKLDRLGLTRMKLPMIRTVQDMGYQVFADAKIDEVPSKVVELAKLHLAYRPWMLNCMAAICSSGISEHENEDKLDGLKRFADLCHAAGTKPCAVTVKTSKSEAMVMREYNGRTPVEQVLVYVEMLREFGFTDVVCSAEEVADIRKESRFDGLELDTPGIRLPKSNKRDQSRVMTPKEAIDAGATRLVIGSDLTDGDFEENFQKIDDNLNPKE